MKDFANPFEIKGKFDFSIPGIVNFVQEKIATETMDNVEDEVLAKKWKLKEKNMFNKVQYKAPRPSDHQQFQTWRVETYLPKAYKMEKVVRAIFEPAVRKIWDKNVVHYQKEPIIANANDLAYFLLSEPEKVLNYDPINFIEKGFHLFHDGKFYHWSSSAYMPNEKGKLEPSNRIP